MRRNLDEVRAELARRRTAYEINKRKRRQRLLYGMPVLVLALVLTAVLVPWVALTGRVEPPATPAEPTSPNPGNLDDPMDPAEPPKASEPTSPEPGANMGNIYGNACDSDGVDSFAELLETAELIVMGTVVSVTEPSPTTETATVRIDATYRAYGDAALPELRLYQLKAGHTVSVGQTYLLFLKKQTEDAADTFYSIGGGQGTLLYDAENERVIAADAHIDAWEALAWLREQERSTP